MSGGVPRWRNLALEAPRQEMSAFIQGSGRKMIGFSGGAQIEKSSPGGAQAGNERFHKEKW